MLQIRKLIECLSDNDVQYVIIGGMAAVVHGANYVTADLDICHERSSENLAKIVEALKPLKPRLRGASSELPFFWDQQTLEQSINLTLVTSAGEIDLLGEVAGIGDFKKVIEAAEEFEIYKRTIWVLNIEGLIMEKQASGRPKDMQLIPELKGLLALREKSNEDG